MSGSDTVNTMKVDLDLDPSGFKSGADQGAAALDKLAAKIGVTAGVAAAAGTLIGTAIGRGINIIIQGVSDAITHMDDLNDASMRIGTSVEHWSALEYAVKLNGTTMAATEMAFKKLSDAMDDTANNKTTQATKALQDLGVEVTDVNGKLRDSHDVFLDIAERFANLKDGTAKTALAVDLFGKSGTQMIQMLNQGKVGITKMEDAARALGITIGQKDADAVNEFKDQLDILRMRLEGLYRLLAETFIPVFNDIYIVFTRTAVGLAGLISQTIAAKHYLENVFTMGATAAAALYGLELDAIDQKFKKLVADTERGFTLPPIPTSPKDQDVDTSHRTKPDKTKKSELEEVIPLEQIFLEQLKEEGKSNEFNRKMIELESAEFKKLNESRDLTIQQIIQLDSLYHQHAITIQQLNDALIGVATTEQDAFGKAADHVVSNIMRIRAALASASTNGAEQWLAMGDVMVDTLSSVFGSSKGLAIAATLINTAQAVMKTLAEYGATPWGWAAAAAVAAMGAAQIAKIMSTSEKGGGGGAASVSGAASAAAAPQQGPSQTLFVEGINPNHIYSGEMVRNLAESLLQYQRDGGRVVLAGGT